MLRSLKDLEHYSVRATDGEVGSVTDFLLDDERWVVRYLVVETGDILRHHSELISPISFRDADWVTRNFDVALTMDNVRNSPSVDTDKPVSRQHERDFFKYYGYPYYWGTSGIWGMGVYPGLLAGAASSPTLDQQSDEPAGDIHLRSAAEVRGYHIQGSDDPIGHIEDFIVDDETWGIQYLVVDTSNWWFGKKVLISPHWADQISWEERMVYVNMTRDAVEKSPEWNESDGINREFQESLDRHYGRSAYTGQREPDNGEATMARSGSKTPVDRSKIEHDKELSIESSTDGDANAPDTNPPRTTSGWLTTPKFGSATSGGGEVEPGPERD